MTDMMVDVIQRGTAQLAKSIGRLDLAGKTGTTNDRRDAWFVGYNADLTVATWIGFDQERTLGEQEEGARTALPMWVHFMDRGPARCARASPARAARHSAHVGVARLGVTRVRGRIRRRVRGVSRRSCAAAPAAWSTVALADGIDAESVEPASSEESIF